MTVPTALGQILTADFISELTEIKASGSLHGVEYSQTVANVQEIEDEDISTDGQGLWLTNMPQRYPTILVNYQGKETIERKGVAVEAEFIFRIIGILRNATHAEIAGFEEDIEFAIEYLRNLDHEKTNDYYLFNHRLISSELSQARLTRHDRDHLEDVSRGRNKDYRICDVTVTVMARYDVTQRRV
jgi:hypothetical protein